MELLNVTWTDPAGEVWDLTSGDKGVLLDPSQSGLGWSSVSHSYSASGQLVASTVDRIEPDLTIELDWKSAGQEFYQLHNKWWGRANSPFREGTLTVERPGGEPRTLRARLRDTPNTTFLHDPGLVGMERGPELWALTSDQSFWHGPPQVTDLRITDATSTGTPFYGASGAGFPFYIGEPSSAGDATLTNRGHSSAWVTWTLQGPISNVIIGHGDSTLRYGGTITAGEQIVIVTEPGRRQVYEAESGSNRFSQVTGVWAPIPVGEAIPMVISAEGMSAGSFITAEITEKYATAF